MKTHKKIKHKTHKGLRKRVVLRAGGRVLVRKIRTNKYATKRDRRGYSGMRRTKLVSLHKGYRKQVRLLLGR